MANNTPNVFGLVVVQAPNTVPATLNQSATWNSGPCPAGYGAIAATVQMDKAGTISIQRYADVGLTAPIGAAITQNVTANTPNSVSVSDGVPYAYFQVSLTNGGSGTANVTGVFLLTGPLG